MTQGSGLRPAVGRPTLRAWLSCQPAIGLVYRIGPFGSQLPGRRCILEIAGSTRIPRAGHSSEQTGRDYSRKISEPSRCTRVATDPGDRNQIREELPLSTRVHELAKELGLKSAELLERIQSWGLDVKASNFASLDPATVDRIRELSAQSASGPRAACAPLRVRASRPAQRSPPPAVSPAPPARASSAEAPAAKTGGHSSGEPGSSRVPSQRPSVPRQSQSWLRAAARPRLRGARSAARPRRSRRAAPAPASPPSSQASAGPRPAFGVAPLRCRVTVASRLASRRRPALGSYSASRNRRPAGRRPAFAGRGSGWSREPVSRLFCVDHRAAPGGFQPLKPGDYMSSAGIRTMTPRVGPSATFLARSRRPPLTVAETAAGAMAAAARARAHPFPRWRRQALRGPSPHRARPRPGPAPKTQRPDKSMNREELLALDAVRAARHLSIARGRYRAPGGGPRGGHQHRPGLSSSSPRGAGPSPPGGPGHAPWPGWAAVGLQAPPPPLPVDEEEENARPRPGGSARPPIAPAAAPGAASAPATAARRRRSPCSALLVDEEETRRTRSGSRKGRGQRLAVARREKPTSRSSLRSPSAAFPRRSGSRPRICFAS